PFLPHFVPFGLLSQGGTIVVSLRPLSAHVFSSFCMMFRVMKDLNSAQTVAKRVEPFLPRFVPYGLLFQGVTIVVPLRPLSAHVSITFRMMKDLNSAQTVAKRVAPFLPHFVPFGLLFQGGTIVVPLRPLSAHVSSSFCMTKDSNSVQTVAKRMAPFLSHFVPF